MVCSLLLTWSTSLHNSGLPEWGLGPPHQPLVKEMPLRLCAGPSAGGTFSSKVPSPQMVPAYIKLTKEPTITLMLHITKNRGSDKSVE